MVNCSRPSAWRTHTTAAANGSTVVAAGSRAVDCFVAIRRPAATSDRSAWSSKPRRQFEDRRQIVEPQLRHELVAHRRTVGRHVDMSNRVARFVSGERQPQKRMIGELATGQMQLPAVDLVGREQRAGDVGHGHRLRPRPRVNRGAARPQSLDQPAAKSTVPIQRLLPRGGVSLERQPKPLLPGERGPIGLGKLDNRVPLAQLHGHPQLREPPAHKLRRDLHDEPTPAQPVERWAMQQNSYNLPGRNERTTKAQRARRNTGTWPANGRESTLMKKELHWRRLAFIRGLSIPSSCPSCLGG